MKSFNTFTFPRSNFSKQKVQPKRVGKINYKNIFLLRKYISIEGKILPRRLTNLNSRQQRDLSKAIKSARIIGFMPFVRRVL